MAEPKKRSTPRISVNKLGEYIVASPARRKTIIKDQKKPRTIYVARYAKAESEIQNHIVEGNDSIEPLAAVCRELISADYPTTWASENAQLCAKALQSFIKVANDIPADGLLSHRTPDNIAKMEIANVLVSVRPEILLSRPETPDKIVGAIKLYFSKSVPLEKGPGEFVASVVYRYIAECLSTETVAEYKHCFVLDVLKGSLFTAPKSYKNHMKQALAACEEIATVWPTIQV